MSQVVYIVRMTQSLVATGLDCDHRAPDEIWIARATFVL